MPSSLYLELVAAGCVLDNHESDLYVEDTEAARAIIGRFPQEQGNLTSFTSQIDQKPWLDIPFAFDPWWERRAALEQHEPSMITQPPSPFMGEAEAHASRLEGMAKEYLQAGDRVSADNCWAIAWRLRTGTH